MATSTLLADADRARVLARMALVQPGTPPRWGRMNAGQMLHHLAEAQRMALGELEVRPRGKRLFRTWLAKYVFIRALPIPKGVPTAPELLSRDSFDCEAERARLAETIARFSGVPRTGRGPEHPLFGVLTWAEWGVLQYKHVDHHLRQFGL